MRNTVVEYIEKFAKKDRNVILISGDLGYGVLDSFRKNLPDQYFNAGISEQNMASVAAGLALEGKKVYLYSIGNFPTLRCIEQIRNDICYHNVNVKIVAVGGGFAYGSLGMSHHATEDIAMMRCLPNMMVFAPADAAEAEAVIKEVMREDGPCYIRLNKGGEPLLHGTDRLLDYNLGKAIPMMSGSEVCLMAAGAIVGEALKAAEMLEKLGLTTALYSFPSIKPIDRECIFECVKKFEVIYTIEEHNVMGGFGSAVCEAVAECGAAVRVKRIGLKDTYSDMVGTQRFLRSYYGMDSKAIVEYVKKGNSQQW